MNEFLKNCVCGIILIILTFFLYWFFTLTKLPKILLLPVYVAFETVLDVIIFKLNKKWVEIIDLIKNSIIRALVAVGINLIIILNAGLDKGLFEPVMAPDLFFIGCYVVVEISLGSLLHWPITMYKKTRKTEA